MDTMDTIVVINGVEYSKPDSFRVVDGLVMGYYYASSQRRYDEEMYWGIATQQNLDALQKAGVPEID